jgi:hypothetical protein
MAITVVRFNCGCRFKTEKVAEAVAHVEKTGHTLEVRGYMKSSTPRLRSTDLRIPPKN